MKFAYSFFMVLFCPLGFGFLLPVIADIYLNKWVYGVYPRSDKYSEYATLVWSPFGLTLSMAAYVGIWYFVKNKMEKKGWDIL